MRNKIRNSKRVLQSFNPRIRDGCEFIKSMASEPTHVSIHASVMDAKVCHSLSDVFFPVSIHASVMDAKELRLVLEPSEMFQSTHP